MTDIADVIGWKFNHQAGMSTKGGVITKFPSGIPSQADQDLWTAEYEAAGGDDVIIQNEILEDFDTPIMQTMIENLHGWLKTPAGLPADAAAMTNFLKADHVAKGRGNR